MDDILEIDLSFVLLLDTDCIYSQNNTGKVQNRVIFRE